MSERTSVLAVLSVSAFLCLGIGLRGLATGEIRSRRSGLVLTEFGATVTSVIAITLGILLALGLWKVLREGSEES